MAIRYKGREPQYMLEMELIMSYWFNSTKNAAYSTMPIWRVENKTSINKLKLCELEFIDIFHMKY